MDLDRPPHLRSSAAAATTELFICFTSRLSSSSSSMKLTKSILSPGRAARDGPASLSSSLSRRLRTNGSLKAGQASPFFTTPSRKRGCAFENPEPSSPKVTCIGQVRVKTKKKVKQSRSLSKRRSGEVSFRKIDGGDGGQQQIEDKRYSNASAHYQPPQEHRNQRWVHLPVSICEALRTFGAEFSCLFPCKTSCFSSERVDKGEKGCGGVFTRWLVSVNDGEGGKRREIELVVGGGDEEEPAASSRRHVFEDIEVKDDRIEVKGQLDQLEEAARVSICIPPKNALLLMRCRSDPMKMADLATRFSWDATKEDIEEEINVEENVVVSEDEPQEQQECEEINDEVIEQVTVEENVVVSQDEPQEQEKCEEVIDEECEEVKDEVTQLAIFGEASQEHEIPQIDTEEIQPISTEEMVAEELEEIVEYEEEEVESNMSSFEALLDAENTAESYEDCPIQDEEVEDNSICHLSPSTESDEDEDIEQTAEEAVKETSHQINEAESEQTETEAETERETENQESVSKKEKVLPECLVLMMREPKLSMEVSKETWVCSRDFIRWLPRNEPLKRRLSIDSKPKTFAAGEPPRSSVIEHKLVNAVAYEPFVLTRCKSEPMRTAAAKLAPESCFWKNAIRKLEPHRRGVGAAGVGF